MATVAKGSHQKNTARYRRPSTPGDSTLERERERAGGRVAKKSTLICVASIQLVFDQIGIPFAASKRGSRARECPSAKLSRTFRLSTLRLGDCVEGQPERPIADRDPRCGVRRNRSDAPEANAVFLVGRFTVTWLDCTRISSISFFSFSFRTPGAARRRYDQRPLQ